MPADFPINRRASGSPRAARRRVPTFAATAATLQSPLTHRVAAHPATPRPAPKAPVVTHAPVSDVRSSGPGYGIAQAKAWRRARSRPQATDAQGGYGLNRARAYHPPIVKAKPAAPRSWVDADPRALAQRSIGKGPFGTGLGVGAPAAVRAARAHPNGPTDFGISNEALRTGALLIPGVAPLYGSYKGAKALVHLIGDVSHGRGVTPRTSREIQSAGISQLPFGSIPGIGADAARGAAEATVRHPLKAAHSAGEIAAATPAGIAQSAIASGQLLTGNPAGAKRLGKQLTADYARRYGPLVAGDYDAYVKRLNEEGTAPELLDMLGVAAFGGATVGRGATALARRGSLGVKAQRLASEPRPELRFGNVTRPQPASPNLFVRAGQKAVDQQRRAAYLRGRPKLRDQMKYGDRPHYPKRDELPVATAAKPQGQVRPLLKSNEARMVRKDISQRQSRAYQTQRQEREAEVTKGVEKSLVKLPKNVRPAVFHEVQGVLPKGAGPIREFAHKRRAQIVAEREGSAAKIAAGHAGYSATDAARLQRLVVHAHRRFPELALDEALGKFRQAQPRDLDLVRRHADDIAAAIKDGRWARHSELRALEHIDQHAEEIAGSSALRDLGREVRERSGRTEAADPALKDPIAEARRYGVQGEILGKRNPLTETEIASRRAATTARVSAAKQEVGAAERGLQTARRQEARQQGATQVRSAQADRATLRKDRPYRKAAARLAAARREMSAAKAEHGNAHRNPDLYDAKRRAEINDRAAAAATELTAAKQGFKDARTAAQGRADLEVTARAQPARQEPTTAAPVAPSIAPPVRHSHRVMGELDAIASDQLGDTLDKLHRREHMTPAEAQSVVDVLDSELQAHGQLTEAHQRGEIGLHHSAAKAMERDARALRDDLAGQIEKAPKPEPKAAPQRRSSIGDLGRKPTGPLAALERKGAGTAQAEQRLARAREEHAAAWRAHRGARHGVGEIPGELKGAARIAAIKKAQEQMLRDWIDGVRAEAARRGLPDDPSYFVHQRVDIERRGDTTMSQIAEGMRGIKRSDLQLIREGRASTNPRLVMQGIQVNIKRAQQWKAAMEVAETHSYPWSRGQNGNGVPLSELWKQMEAHNVDPNSVVIQDVKLMRAAAEDFRDEADIAGPNPALYSALHNSMYGLDGKLSDAVRGVLGGDKRAGSDALRGGDIKRTQGSYLAYPKAAGKELLDGAAPALWPLRASAKILGGFSATILGLNPSWLMMQVAANTLAMTFGARGALGELAKSHPLYAKLSEEDRKWLDNIGGIGVMRGHSAPQLGAVGGRYTEAARRMGQTNIAAVLKKGNPINLMFGADELQNRAFRRAVMSNALKRRAFQQIRQESGRMAEAMARMEQLLKMGPTDGVMKQVDGILKNPAEVEKLAQHVNNVLGDFTRYTAFERRWLKSFTLFYGFLRYATRLAFYTMPMHHPIMSAIALKLGQLHRQEVQDLLGGDEAPYAYGRIFFTGKGGQLSSIDLSRINPATTPLTETLSTGNPKALLGMLSPVVQMATDQMYGGSLYEGGRGFRVGGSRSENRNPTAQDRLRIVANDTLSSAWPYRMAVDATQGADDKGDDNLLFDERPLQSKTPQSQATEAQQLARAGSTGQRLLRQALPLFFPRPDFSREQAARTRAREGTTTSSSSSSSSPPASMSAADRRELARVTRQSTSGPALSAADRREIQRLMRSGG
jgi:hypothetical protein